MQGATCVDGGKANPKGGTAAMGQHLLPWPWVPGGILPRVPGCLWVMLLGPAGCYRQPSAATSCPSRRWHAGSQGSLTELVGNPTASRGDIATALGFHRALCARQRGGRALRVICLGAEPCWCIFPVSATQWPRFVLHFSLSGFLNPTDPPANASILTAGGIGPAASPRPLGQGWSWGQNFSPPSPRGCSQLLWPSQSALGGSAGLKRRSRVCHDPRARAALTEATVPLLASPQ